MVSKNVPANKPGSDVENPEGLASTQAYVSSLFKKLQEDFLKANEDLDMDFVYMTSWLYIDAKGNFVEKSGDEIIEKFGDTIDVVIAKGEQKFCLWGEEDSPEEGELIVAEDTREGAEKLLAEWLEVNPQAIERYSAENIQSRYIAYVIPVEKLKEDVPKIYTLGLAPTSKMAYGTWGFNVFKGAYADKGIPKDTGINRVVTRISTVSKTNKQKQQYTALAFEAVEMFDPKKYTK